MAVLAVAGAVAFVAHSLKPPRVPVPPMGTYRFTRVTVVEPGVARRLAVTLTVRDGVIEAAEPTASERPEAATGGGGDLAGTTVLPGLIDLHVHHPPAWFPGGRELFALLFLAHGVTSVRDMGSHEGDALEIDAPVAAGEHPGPRTFACGPLLEGSEPEWPGSMVVETDADAEQAIADLGRRGARCAKLYNTLSSQAVAALLDAARAARLPVAGHVPARVSLRALKGVEVQHLMGAARSGEQLDAGRAALVARLAASLGQRHTPTLVAFQHYAERARAGKRANALPGAVRPQLYDPAALPLPGALTEVFWDRTRNARLAGIAPESGADPGTHLARVKHLASTLIQARIPVLAGTDTPNPGVIPGASLHEELVLLVEAGLDPETAWQTATRTAAEALQEPLLGQLGPGAPADLLFFREDPTRNLTAVATLEAVMARGRLYRRTDLEAALDAHRRYTRRRAYELASTWLMRVALVGSGEPTREAASDEPASSSSER